MDIIQNLLFFLAIAIVTCGLTLVVSVVGGNFASRLRKVCPACLMKALKCINWFRVNPPPNYSFFKCGNCKAEYIEYMDEMIPRAGSNWENHTGWNNAV
jgi:hypothetical protein